MRVVLVAFMLFAVYSFTGPENHTEAEDVYDYALRVEQGSFSDQAGVNRLLALPAFGAAYHAAQALGYDGRAFPFMIFINRLLAVACIFLFYQLILENSTRRLERDQSSTPPQQPSTINDQLPAAMLLAFSYGFWRYANEAETYMLAMFIMLAAWVLAIFQPTENGRQRKAGRGHLRPSVSNPSSAPLREINPSILRPLSSVFCPLVSALGILIHLLNVVPLLVIIPFYYLLSREWKKALIHVFVVSALVAVGYGLSAPYLDWSLLGAKHHALEAGWSLGNMARALVAFGQNLVSGNFLFGFDSFRELLARLFPSRVLAEEFFMGSSMPGWIPWTGVATLFALGAWSTVLGVKVVAGISHSISKRSALSRRLSAVGRPLTLSVLAWLVLYAFAVIRTEAGSPELWLMALVPFWLLVATVLQRVRRAVHGGPVRPYAVSCMLLAVLFIHNLVAGLLPVMSEASDYHRQKGKWLVEHAQENDLILTSYEPVMIFYLDYFAKGQIVNSSEHGLADIERMIEESNGNVYALDVFFRPLGSMTIRSPEMVERMRNIGLELEPRFQKIVDDDFGGVYRLRTEG